MKKVLCGILAIMMMLSLICAGALAEAVDFTGEWYASVYGITMKMTLNADGSYTMEMSMEGEEPMDGVWEFDGAALVMDKGTEDEASLNYDAEANSLCMEQDGIEFVFTREMPEAFEAAPVRADASLEEFAGTWACTLVSLMGMQAAPEELGVNLGLSIDGATVALTLENFVDSVEVTLEGAFADGALTVTLPTESEYEDDTVFTLQLLEDGSMSASSLMMDEEIVYYMSME